MAFPILRNTQIDARHELDLALRRLHNCLPDPSYAEREPMCSTMGPKTHPFGMWGPPVPTRGGVGNQWGSLHVFLGLPSPRGTIRAGPFDIFTPDED